MAHSGLLQVAQRVEDLDRAVSFYESVLGLPLVARFDQANMAVFDLGGVRLLLGPDHDASSLYLAVDDIDRAVRQVTEAGARLERAPTLVHTDELGQLGEPGVQEWMAFIWDSEGNLLGLVERREPAGPSPSRPLGAPDGVRRLDHVQLAMPEGREPEAVDFYERLLGIPLVPKPVHLAARGGCWFERDELKVHLGVDPHFRPATKAHPAFVVDGVRSLAATLADAGHRVIDDEPLDGYERVYVDDPFGNRIELMEPSTRSVRAHVRYADVSAHRSGGVSGS